MARPTNAPTTHGKRESLDRIRRAAERRGLDASDIARMTGLPPGQARAILSGFGDLVPQEQVDRTVRDLAV